MVRIRAVFKRPTAFSRDLRFPTEYLVAKGHVSTGYLAYNVQLATTLWYYRAYVARDHRHSAIGAAIRREARIVTGSTPMGTTSRRLAT